MNNSELQASAINQTIFFLCMAKSFIPQNERER
jgi:hypothetical protein